jgi:hypothetical protein
MQLFVLIERSGYDDPAATPFDTREAAFAALIASLIETEGLTEADAGELTTEEAAGAWIAENCKDGYDFVIREIALPGVVRVSDTLVGALNWIIDDAVESSRERILGGLPPIDALAEIEQIDAAIALAVEIGTDHADTFADRYINADTRAEIAAAATTPPEPFTFDEASDAMGRFNLSSEQWDATPLAAQKALVEATR